MKRDVFYKVCCKHNMAFTRCVKCGELRFDKHVNRCGSCGSEGYQD